jgi:hypothetical protein
MTGAKDSAADKATDAKEGGGAIAGKAADIKARPVVIV